MAIGDKKSVVMKSDIGSKDGVAPAGYGLGEISGHDIPINPTTGNRDLNLATVNGLYHVYG